jgi:hypothetical protein
MAKGRRVSTEEQERERDGRHPHLNGHLIDMHTLLDTKVLDDNVESLVENAND